MIKALSFVVSGMYLCYVEHNMKIVKHENTNFFSLLIYIIKDLQISARSAFNNSFISLHQGQTLSHAN